MFSPAGLRTQVLTGVWSVTQKSYGTDLEIAASEVVLTGPSPLFQIVINDLEF